MRRLQTLALKGGALVAALVALLGVAGAGWEAWSERSDDVRFPPPGEFVTIGHGRRMHIFCEGRSQRDRATVILEAGANGDSILMRPVQDRVAAFARVCAYDRAGLGWSAPAPGARDFDARANDLSATLDAAGIKGPLLLVGESFGGLVLRRYAAIQPDRVKGVIFVDAAEEGVAFGALSNRLVSDSVSEARARAWESRFGLVRLAMSVLPDSTGLADVPPALRAPFTSRVARPAYWRVAGDEGLAFTLTPQDMRKPSGFGRLGDIPVLAIAHDKPLEGPMSGVEADWRAGQERLARLSTCGGLVVAKGMGHDIDLAAPDLVAAAVREIGGWSASTKRCVLRRSA